jgi:hypothetical protein
MPNLMILGLDLNAVVWGAFLIFAGYLLVGWPLYKLSQLRHLPQGRSPRRIIGRAILGEVVWLLFLVIIVWGPGELTRVFAGTSGPEFYASLAFFALASVVAYFVEYWRPPGQMKTDA